MSEFQPPDTEEDRESMAEAHWDKQLTDAYAEGRKDEQEELASVLPGTYYMDPPDGGSVTVLEQLRRMAKDAELGRRVREHQEAAIACELRCEG